MALLSSMFGKSVQKLRLEHKTFQPAGTKKKIEITTVASNYHIEINPSDANLNDRFVVQEIIKEIAQFHLPDKSATRHYKGNRYGFGTRLWAALWFRRLAKSDRHPAVADEHFQERF